MIDSTTTRSPRERLPPPRRGPALLALCLATLSGDAIALASRPPSAGPSYATPPAPGDTLHAARDTVRCDSERGARFTARTGFLAAGCRLAARGSRWRVIACRHVDLADGGLWLIEVRAVGARTEPDSAAPVWIPLPWHDWA